MRYAKQTLDRIAAARAEGAEIVVNADWRYPTRECRKTVDGYGRIKALAFTNDRYKGFAKRIVWACYPAQASK